MSPWGGVCAYMPVGMGMCAWISVVGILEKANRKGLADWMFWVLGI